MADPQPYVRSYSFRAFPNDRQNVGNMGLLLDREFNLIAGVTQDVTGKLNNFLQKVVVIPGEGQSTFVDGVMTLFVPPLDPGTGAADGTAVVYATTPAGAVVAIEARVVFCIGAASWALWVPSQPPLSGGATPTLVQDAAGRWWKKLPAEGTDTGGGVIEFVLLLDASGNPVRLIDENGNTVTAKEG